LSVDEARAEFVRFRARQFDPAICDRILDNEAWTEIYRSYQEQSAHNAPSAAARTKAS
jgi:hypothetical protein